MRSLLTALVGSLLAISVVASPAVEVKHARRDTCKKSCKHDGCLLSLLSVLPAPLESLAKKDCSSFFRTTVTPSATTSTHTMTITVTDPAKTATAFYNATTTYSTVTEITPVPYTLTVTDTEIMVVGTDEVTVSSTVVVPVTASSTAVATVTIAPPQARGLQPIRMPNVNVTIPILADRAIAFGKSVPTYAFACAGTSFYSSACSCLSVTHSTVTATQPTVYVTTTATAHATVPASTITKTAVQSVLATTAVGSSQGFNVTATQYISSILTTTDATAVYDVTTTVVDAVTVITTVVPVQTCASFQLQVVGGSFFQNTGTDGFAIFNTAGTTYTLDANKQVVSGTQIWDVDNNSYSFIDVNSQSEITSGGYATLACNIANDQTFTCTSSHGLNTFYTCNDAFSGYPRISTSVPAGCSAITIKAIPTC